MHAIARSIAVTLLLLSTPALFAEEGMWLLDAVQKLPLERMRPHGLTLDADDIFDPDSTSLKDAIVNLGGGTGSFISDAGLILTNHHVAYGSLQALSSVQNDYLRDGYLARTRRDELSTSTTAGVILGMREVTDSILADLSDTLSADQRSGAIQDRMRAVEAAATGPPGAAHRVVEMYAGLRYYLFTTLTLRDVRIVYAPPSSIGNFGGETDNWMWPRHTGDFTILRAYTAPDGSPAKFDSANIPYRPRRFLPVSSDGVREGDVAMIMGFPGRTFRYREAAAVEVTRDVTLPAQVALYRARIAVIESLSAGDRSIGIRYASKVRGIANASKKYSGVLEGMRRSDLTRLKREEEERLARAGNGSPADRAAFTALLGEMQSAADDLRRVEANSQFFSNVTSAVEMIGVANRFLTYASLPEGSGERPEKEIASMREYLDRTLKNHESRVDRAMLVMLLLTAAAAPPDARVDVFRRITGNRTGEELESHVREYVEDLYTESRLSTRAGCEELLMADEETILDDPIIRLARRLQEERKPVTEAVNAHAARIDPLRRRYVAAVLERSAAPVTYPDANGTLRFTYGTVQGLRPRDAVVFAPQTYLTGVMEKAQDTAPFIVPSRLRELYDGKDFGRWTDRERGDVPVAFLSDLDITGGNSGSPVINGRGELIGCAFDGNWEGVVGDYLYQERYNRTISVDARYILFILEKFAGAENVMRELVIY